MRVPYTWLAEWVAVPWPAAELGTRLTMAGFELEALERAAPPFSGVVVAQITEATPHPGADTLQICKVTIGQGDAIQIVCGAANARPGLKSALAMVGAALPGGLAIKAAKLRGVDSNGMLCSAKELGLAESSNGILELPDDAPLGVALRDFLALDEPVIQLSVTANRGDAMSIVGVAREVAALATTPVVGPSIEPVPAQINDTFPVRLEAPQACPRFAGRVIKGVDNRAVTPVWLRERLRRCGVRSISPVVDVTNYILLELGQPMHAYDLGKLRDGIRVRLAAPEEKLTLLDGRTIAAAGDMLFIADSSGPIGMAGIMGGERTSVSLDTSDVFFEVAWFAPDAIRGRGRRLGLLTDASQRYERGVDPAMQERALERATALLMQIAGGRPGPVTLVEAREHVPVREPVKLRKSQLKRLLGADIEPARVTTTLAALQMEVASVADGWQARPPSHRFDIAIEADLIEEVARIIGFDAIGKSDAIVAQQFSALPDSVPVERAVLETLIARGYYETINYAFTDPARQQRLFPDRSALSLSNPLSSDLSAMRVSLWPGLLNALLLNQHRQQERVRLFERGTRFETHADGSTLETDSIAGVACGERLPEQWGVAKGARAIVDFFDVKADVEALLAGAGASCGLRFEPAGLPCLHPGRAARIHRDGLAVGWLGELHPTLVRELGFTYPPVLFELDYATALHVKQPKFQEFSRFPQVRRDIAVVLDESISLSELRERVTSAAPAFFRICLPFDVYRGPGVESGRKSVALGLIFQDISRTLTDAEIEGAVAAIVSELRVSLKAKIRE